MTSLLQDPALLEAQQELEKLQLAPLQNLQAPVAAQVRRTPP